MVGSTENPGVGSQGARGGQLPTPVSLPNGAPAGTKPAFIPPTFHLELVNFFTQPISTYTLDMLRPIESLSI